MNYSDCKGQPKKQEDNARRKKVKEEEAGSGNQAQTVSIMVLDQITKFIYLLDGSLSEGNI
jgi:hypothetical protein